MTPAEESAALQAENAALRARVAELVARVQELEARQAKDEHATEAGQQRVDKPKHEMFGFLPSLLRPIARVGFGCFGLGTALFGVVALLVIFFPQWVGPDGAVVIAFTIAGAIAWFGGMLSLVIIGFKMT